MSTIPNCNINPEQITFLLSPVALCQQCLCKFDTRTHNYKCPHNKYDYNTFRELANSRKCIRCGEQKLIFVDNEQYVLWCRHCGTIISDEVKVMIPDRDTIVRFKSEK